MYRRSNRHMSVQACVHVCAHTHVAHSFNVFTYMHTWIHFSRISALIWKGFLHAIITNIQTARNQEVSGTQQASDKYFFLFIINMGGVDELFAHQANNQKDAIDEKKSYKSQSQDGVWDMLLYSCSRSYHACENNKVQIHVQYA